MINIRKFHKEKAGDFAPHWFETEQDRSRYIVSTYLAEIAKALNLTPVNVEWVNESKSPDKYFQYNCYLDNGFIIWACFCAVVNGKVIKRDSKIELLNEDWGKIKTIR